MSGPRIPLAQLAENIAMLSANEMAELVNQLSVDHRTTLAGRLNRDRNEVMVALINSHNPYTDHAGQEMSIFVGNPNPNNHANDHVNQIELEVDGPYAMPMEWNFKGSPQKINKTLRLKYRYRARNLDIPNRPLLDPPHWVTAYLLIGFEDGGA
jgi:hypothetical protein